MNLASVDLVLCCWLEISCTNAESITHDWFSRVPTHSLPSLRLKLRCILTIADLESTSTTSKTSKTTTAGHHVCLQNTCRHRHPNNHACRKRSHAYTVCPRNRCFSGIDICRWLTVTLIPCGSVDAYPLLQSQKNYQATSTSSTIKTVSTQRMNMETYLYRLGTKENDSIWRKWQ